MPDTIVSSSDVVDYLGLGSDFDTTGLAAICSGIESAVKNFCRWQILDTEITAYLPRRGEAYGIHIPTVSLLTYTITPSGPRNRLQLPAPWVTAVESVHVDLSAFADQGDDDYSASTELVAGTDYYLETDNDAGDVSRSGFLVRTGDNWPSIPGSIRVVFNSGFTDEQLAAEHYALRFALIQEAANAFFRLSKARKAFVTGLGEGGDKSGLIRSERLGDYSVSFADPLGDPNDTSGTGLSQRLQDFLQINGYVYWGVGV